MRWRDKLRFYLARWMIKFNKLTHDAFTINELNQLLEPYFPYQHKLAVPVGNGTLTLERAELRLNDKENKVEVQISSSLKISAMGNPIYRAHLAILISAQPDYVPGSDKIYAKQVQVADIYMLNDEYALLLDSATLLDRFMPMPVTPILRGPVKNMLRMVTAGLADDAMAYLQIYLSGNKQRVLDYHKPQLESFIAQLARDNKLEYQLDKSDWQELLFYHFGKAVAIEQQELRFKF